MNLFMTVAAFAIVLVCNGMVAADPTNTSSASASTKYLDVVKRACDALLENARDNYGPQHSGMIISLLDRHTGKPLLELIPPTGKNRPGGIRDTDDVPIGGCNTNLQLDLHRCFFNLSRLTGDPRYAEAAKQALLDFMKITQHPKTGLLAWGEHLSWDCLNDRIGAPPRPVPDAGYNRRLIHEPKRKFLFYDQLLEWDTPRALKYAQGLWEHQIYDQQSGDFSRHAAYDKHEPGKGYDFPKEGGYFIETWSLAYAKTKDPTWAKAVQVLANRFLSRMQPSGRMDYDTIGTPPDRLNKTGPLHNLSLAIDAYDAASRMDPQTGALLRRLSEGLDRGFLSMKHEVADPSKGFIQYAATDTGEAIPRPKRNHKGYSLIWAMGYGCFTTSQFAVLCYARQAQLGAGPQGNAYRKLVIEAAKEYQKVPPDIKKREIWAGAYGTAIFTELAAYRLTDDASYLATARKIADYAIDVLWEGGSPLPRASWSETNQKTDYYNGITYSDTLMLSLLALHEAVAGLPPKVEISDIVR